jgi:hypothetical protein
LTDLSNADAADLSKIKAFWTDIPRDKRKSYVVNVQHGTDPSNPTAAPSDQHQSKVAMSTEEVNAESQATQQLSK